MNINRPRAVVCDMDGLLVDSERAERRVWQAAARDCGFAIDDALFLTFVGRGADEADAVLVGRFGARYDAAAFRAQRRARMAEVMAAEGVPYKPGARALLDWLAGLGVPIGLATSSGPPLVRERLRDVLPMFAAVATRADVARGKPAPDLYLLAAERLGVAPADCLALEDSPPGVRAAAAAGMPVLVVPDLVPPPADVLALVAGRFASLVEVRAALAEAWGVAEPAGVSIG